MANPAYGYGAFQKTSRFEEKDAKRAAAATRWRDVCRQVDRRDRYRCRACGMTCDPDSLTLLERGHRHHLTYRSKQGADTPTNVITLCARCHDREHRHRLRIDPTTPYGADGPVEIWRLDDKDQWFLSRRETACGQTERD